MCLGLYLVKVCAASRAHGRGRVGETVTMLIWISTPFWILWIKSYLYLPGKFVTIPCNLNSLDYLQEPTLVDSTQSDSSDDIIDRLSDYRAMGNTWRVIAQSSYSHLDIHIFKRTHVKYGRRLDSFHRLGATPDEDAYLACFRYVPVMRDTLQLYNITAKEIWWMRISFATYQMLNDKVTKNPTISPKPLVWHKPETCYRSCDHCLDLKLNINYKIAECNKKITEKDNSPPFPDTGVPSRLPNIHIRQVLSGMQPLQIR